MIERGAGREKFAKSGRRSKGSDVSTDEAIPNAETGMKPLHKKTCMTRTACWSTLQKSMWGTVPTDRLAKAGKAQPPRKPEQTGQRRAEAGRGRPRQAKAGRGEPRPAEARKKAPKKSWEAKRGSLEKASQVAEKVAEKARCHERLEG